MLSPTNLRLRLEAPACCEAGVSSALSTAAIVATAASASQPASPPAPAPQAFVPTAPTWPIAQPEKLPGGTTLSRGAQMQLLKPLQAQRRQLLPAMPPDYWAHLQRRAAVAWAPAVPSPLAQSASEAQVEAAAELLNRGDAALRARVPRPKEAAQLWLEAWRVGDRESLCDQFAQQLLAPMQPSSDTLALTSLKLACFTRSQKTARYCVELACRSYPSAVPMVLTLLAHAKRTPALAACYVHLSRCFEETSFLQPLLTLAPCTQMVDALRVENFVGARSVAKRLQPHWPHLLFAGWVEFICVNLMNFGRHAMPTSPSTVRRHTLWARTLVNHVEALTAAEHAQALGPLTPEEYRWLWTTFLACYMRLAPADFAVEAAKEALVPPTTGGVLRGLPWHALIALPFGSTWQEKARHLASPSPPTTSTAESGPEPGPPALPASAGRKRRRACLNLLESASESEE